MKKIILLCLAVLIGVVAISCKKEKVETKQEVKVNIKTILVSEVYQIYKESESGFIPVDLTPSSANLIKHARVTCEPEDVIDFTVAADGITVTPKKIGEATLTIAPKYGDGKSAECLVSVVNNPALPSSISIVRDDHFVDGRLELAANDTYQLKAIIKNAAGEVTTDYQPAFNLVPYSMEGLSGLELGADGKLTVSSATGQGEAELFITVGVMGFTKINDHVMADVLPIPTKIKVNFTGKYTLNADKELIIKKGASAPFTVATEPANAIKHLTASTRYASKATVTLEGDSGTVTAGASSSATPVSLTFSSPYNTDITETCQIYVVDYDADDVKEGDWVYSNKFDFMSMDCGLRLAGASPIYVNAQGKRSTTPLPHPGLNPTGRYNYVGVIVSTVLPQDDDFLGCSLLAQCKSGSSATGLYEYKDFRKSKLCGFTNAKSVHALVVKKNEVVEQRWQKENCELAGQGDIQLPRQNAPFFTFSPEQADYWTGQYNMSTNPQDHHTCIYNSFGFLSHLLMRYYSLKKEQYMVNPVMCINSIEAFNDVPKISDGKGTTGWFLPGDYEFQKFGIYAAIVNASLKASTGTSSLATISADCALSGSYWTTLEEFKDYVFKYTVSSNTATRSEVMKNTAAYTRAFLYL